MQKTSDKNCQIIVDISNHSIEKSTKSKHLKRSFNYIDIMLANNTAICQIIKLESWIVQERDFYEEVRQHQEFHCESKLLLCTIFKLKIKFKFVNIQ